MTTDRHRWAAVLERLDRVLAAHVERLHARGRIALTEAVPGGVVDDSEAANLVAELVAYHAGATPVQRNATSSVADAPAGLARAARVFDLAPRELELLVLAVAPELDHRYARLFGYLNDHAARQRPTIGMALELFGSDLGDDHVGAPAIQAMYDRWTRLALVELDGDGPFSTRSLRLASGFWPRLFDPDRSPAIGTLVSTGTQLAELVLEPVVRDRARAIVEALASGASRTVIVRGPDGSGRDALALALALALEGPALVVAGDAMASDPRAVVREARWAGATLIASGGAIAGLEDLTRPLIRIAELDGLEDVIATRPDAVEIRIERPGLIAARRIWERFLPDTLAPELDLGTVVSRFPFSPRRISAAAHRALVADRGAPIATANVLAACRSLPDRRFDGLAERLPSTSTWDDLVLGDGTRRELELILAWARGGRVTLQEWGITPPSCRGLACLFHGPPGTGKTLAAQVLATAIGVDVVRIDLSQVVSKYIGETEKNLGRVFDAAREANVILFFDEADALFGKRTAVKDAHDRNANIETGYLLQRLETHEGLTVLATNLRANLDAAFLRRLQVMAEFHLPEPVERRRIWDRALPPPPIRDPDVDVDLLALKFAISGAEIRNTVMTAALLASGEGRPLAMTHLVRGLLRELRKAGRMVDLDDFGIWRGEALRHAGAPQPS